ncbi:RNA polymerase subunit sigma-70 [Loigolactobacillus zhaoyuanensis]|uniref:RNA polymerase subunit sigma-70 n=1 Tax=Loigolactobacillus zhaoyuanensis TaxID=2486017 RepID=A0ABW8UFM5_9LACO|nr:RNA polymerase subunit sigma-70 [Loigolactobacillus zhaoyuanensis]
MYEEELTTLITAAAAGNSNAFEHLFYLYRPMLKKIQQQYYLYQFDDDDWDQEARIICFRAARSYRSDTRLTFGRYYQRCLLCRIYTLLRRQNAKKRQIDRHTVSIEIDEIKRRVETKGSLQSLNWSLIRAHADDFIGQLSELEQIVFYRQLAISFEWPSTIVAEVTEAQERNALDRCRRKLKKYLADHVLM